MELERFKPGTGSDGELYAQHLARYVFAAPYAAGRRTIDVACGTGYGSSLLRTRGAASVTGIDLSEEAIVHAKREYAADGVSFLCGDVSLLASAGSAECVVSFETIEHLTDPETLLVPAREILGGPGLFIVSTPIRRRGALADPPVNPFHVREWSEEEFDLLLSRHFTQRRFFYQYAYRKRPWPLSRTINRLLLRAFFGRRSDAFASFPVVDRPWEMPGALIERAYMIVVCSAKAE
jgi:SAM-dependent methyltransferase